MTRPPKLLPWIARKAGISGERAQEIWRESVRYAMRQIESTGKPDYSRIVMERLRELVEQEKIRCLGGTA
jgi:hypothetical protein